METGTENARISLNFGEVAERFKAYAWKAYGRKPSQVRILSSPPRTSRCMALPMTKFNKDQAKQLAEFTSNLGIVFFASVIAPLFTNIDSVNILSVLFGLGATGFSLTLSLLLLRR